MGRRKHHRAGLTRPANLRLIGGAWRGRKIAIGDAPGLRPTPARVRETLFNWLAPRITGAHCIDLFAGTGALGLEALSRGAAEVVFVDRDPAVVKALDEDLVALDAVSRAKTNRGDAMGYLRERMDTFDIVFLDPPFSEGLVVPCLTALQARLAPGHRVYVEHEKGAAFHLPSGVEILKSGRAGQVVYGLMHWAEP
jgi:16S rRNA (guanine966-N2)-methyltransferase